MYIYIYMYTAHTCPVGWGRRINGMPPAEGEDSSNECTVPSRLGLQNKRTASCRGRRFLQREYCGPVGWGCRTHGLVSSRGITLPQWMSSYDIKQSDGETSVMLKLWRMWSTPSSLSLPSSLWPIVVESVEVLSVGQTELNHIITIEWIVWNELFLQFIIIIMSRRPHGYPWHSVATSPYHSSPPAGLQGYILSPHIVAICKFVLVVLLLLIHM